MFGERNGLATCNAHSPHQPFKKKSGVGLGQQRARGPIGALGARLGGGLPCPLVSKKMGTSALGTIRPGARASFGERDGGGRLELPLCFTAS